MRQRISIALAGHVDHGKSSVVGRLLHDTGAYPADKIQALRERFAAEGKAFEYAHMLDALRDERRFGITIDTARAIYRDGDTEVIFLDGPGHPEFIRNLATGLSHADCVLVVVDVLAGVTDDLRRQLALLSILGLPHAVWAVNKMDLARYEEHAFGLCADRLRHVAAEFGLPVDSILPVSAVDGENVVAHTQRMPWFDGATLRETLLATKAAPSIESAPFRMFVQSVHKIQERSIVAGTIAAGALAVGDTVVVHPHGRRMQLEDFADGGERRVAGEAVGLVLVPIDAIGNGVGRGDLLSRDGDVPPLSGTKLTASVYWAGRGPLEAGRTYQLRIGTSHREARAIALRPSDCRGDQEISAIYAPDSAMGTFELAESTAFDCASTCAQTSTCAIVSDGVISGLGRVINGDV
ncbi:MAG: hypothetical protein IT290_08930 [Deltaproteobacteria bacterium]|nr:hypothetical protein [Deltaproteobacteria bacterium]